MKVKPSGAWLFAALLGWGAAAPSPVSGAEAAPVGEQVYASFCASCHGRYGRGDGPIAMRLTVKRPDFTDSAWLGGRSDEQILAGLMGAPHARMTPASSSNTR
jgi:mono/diheme cytochrome c family protein